MSTLLYLGQLATGLDENEAQSTVEPIRTDPDQAELASDPEWNAVTSDDSGQLVGLSPRVVGSPTEGMEQAAPVGLVMGTYTSARDGNDGVDNQVASSGTAAAREAAGQFGHGTILEEVGIEPLNPAQEYGNDFFQVPDPGANYASGAYMTPAEADNWPQAVAQSSATARSRTAYQASLYDAFFGASA